MQIATIVDAPVLSLFSSRHIIHIQAVAHSKLKPRIPKRETDWACRYPEESVGSVAAFQQTPSQVGGKVH